MRIRVMPYKMGSASGKALAGALGALRINRDSSKMVPRVNDVIINWGCSSNAIILDPARVINQPQAVARASDKLATYRALAESVTAPYIVRYTTEKRHTLTWLDAGETVVCRTKLNGHSGEGIVLATTPEELVDAPMYTLYQKKVREWRVHVVGGRVVLTQRKARRLDVPDEQVNWKVRNHQNGFIYAHKDVGKIPPILGTIAREAVKVLGLDFGAVDVIEDKRGSLFILEVNTACGMEGNTLDQYAKAFNTTYLNRPVEQEEDEEDEVAAIKPEGWGRMEPELAMPADVGVKPYNPRRNFLGNPV